jgi:hypothetical protein
VIGFPAFPVAVLTGITPASLVMESVLPFGVIAMLLCQPSQDAISLSAFCVTVLIRVTPVVLET